MGIFRPFLLIPAMPSTIRLDGAALASELRAGFKIRVAELARAGRQPGLAVLMAGDNPASQVYVRNKIKSCAEVGIHSEQQLLPGNVSEVELLATIATLNVDPRIHGILVQLPLPRHIDEARVLAAINPEKDADGFHIENAGALAQGAPKVVPCTPMGVMRMLEKAEVPVEGAEAVVLGRSNIVGKPMALLLTLANATVAVCHSKTRHLVEHTRRADILISAIGRPHFITGDMIKKGAVLIDVGINREAETNKILGDIDDDSCNGIASMISPVPGGVGPMTIAMLLANTIEAAARSS